jgi:hypothetical protein
MVAEVTTDSDTIKLLHKQLEKSKHMLEEYEGINHRLHERIIFLERLCDSLQGKVHPDITATYEPIDRPR